MEFLLKIGDTAFFRVVREATPLLIQGLGVTVQATLLSLAIACVLGLVMCLMGISKTPLKYLSKFYVWIIRGTPFIVQLFIIHFGIPQLMGMLGVEGFRLSSFQSGVITLSLNAGAYLSEIFRGGIQAVNVGQMEAAQSLGLPRANAMMNIILPQAIRISIPSIGNQFIITLKDSSLAQVIGMAEIVYQGKIYVGRTMQSFFTYVLIGIIYLIIISVLTKILNIIERKLDYGRKG